MRTKERFELDYSFENAVVWRPFIDRHDAEVLAEALHFYKEHLASTDPTMNSVCSLIDHLFKECSAFGARITSLEAQRRHDAVK